LAGLKRYILDNQLVGSGKKFVAVVSGANMNFDRLRFVAERAALGEGREALLSVDIPEQPGRCARRTLPKSSDLFAQVILSPPASLRCTPLYTRAQ